MSTLFIVLGFICLLMASHPFTTYPWSLLVLQALKPGRAPAAHERVAAAQLHCAICVCAYNEERIIERKVQNLLALRDREPGLEILVYVDCASDRTAEILQRYAHLIDLHIAGQRHGKTYGMNLLASQATAPILIFTDANVMMDLDCVRDFKRYFANPDIGCVCGNLVYTNGASSTTAASGSVYWRFEETIKWLEAETGSMMGADGSLFAVRRALHQPPPEHLIDDMYVSLMVICSGYRVVQAHNDALAYEESVVSSREEFKRKIRIACQAFNVHRLLWPKLCRLDSVTLYKYISHKLIRWFTIYLLVAAALCFEIALLASGYYQAAVLLPVTVVFVFSLGHFWNVKPFVQLIDILAAFAGTGVGIWRSLRGERYQTWTPATSIRQ